MLWMMRHQVINWCSLDYYRQHRIHKNLINVWIQADACLIIKTAQIIKCALLVSRNALIIDAYQAWINFQIVRFKMSQIVKELWLMDLLLILLDVLAEGSHVQNHMSLVHHLHIVMTQLILFAQMAHVDRHNLSALNNKALDSLFKPIIFWWMKVAHQINLFNVQDFQEEYVLLNKANVHHHL